MKNRVLLILVISIMLVIFSPWFFAGEIIGGDWPFFYQEMLSDFHLLAPLWVSQQGIGLGGVNALFPFLSYLYFIVGFFVKTIHFPWEIVYRVFFFILPAIFSYLSIRSLIGKIFKKNTTWRLGLGLLIYCINTYFLLLASGGQAGIMLAYSLAPLVLVNFIKNFDSFLKEGLSLKSINYRQTILTGIVFSLQFVFDLRLAYLTLLASFLYFIFWSFCQKMKLVNNIIVGVLSFLIPFIILFLIHFYWIIPFIVFNLLSASEGITSSEGFKFFSFANFSDAFSLLHPNWPENIFGKVYFMRPEFLVIPIIAYSALFFKGNKKEKKNVVFFALLGILGSFLAKGANPPFGYINEWLFSNLPGMNLFRDPTKFYLLTTVSYVVLIPFLISELIVFLKKTKHSFLGKTGINLIPFIFLILWIFLIRQIFLGHVGGTFKAKSVPQEYVELKDFIVAQPKFFRTFWVPFQSRFRIQTETHPLINANTLFKTDDYDEIVRILKRPETYEFLQNLSIKYIIIPYDSMGEIFLEDRKYDSKKRADLEEKIDNLGIFRKIQEGRIVIYEIDRFKDHFFLELEGEISYKKVDSSDYSLKINLSHPLELIFSESYHPQWKASVDDQTINSRKTKDGLNSFLLSEGEYDLEVYFLPDKYMKYFYAVSIFSFLVIVFYLLHLS